MYKYIQERNEEHAEATKSARIQKREETRVVFNSEEEEREEESGSAVRCGAAVE